MKNSIDLKRCLMIFDKVMSDGEKKEDKFHYEGLEAWSDFDGYNCYLSLNDVMLTMMFHGKYDIQFGSADSFQKFEKKLATFKL